MRYDIEALEQKLGTFLTLSTDGAQFAPDAGLAVALGMSRSAVQAGRTRGLSADQADRYAVRAGYHPSLVWPSWFDDAEDDARDAERLAEWWGKLDRWREIPALRVVA